MIEPQSVVVILLAAGRGSRLGGRKLALPLGGAALGLHAARMLTDFRFKARVAVCSEDAPDFAGLGFECVEAPQCQTALSRSIRVGMEAAEAHNPAAVLIALADMPLVPASHIAAMLAAFTDDRVATLAAAPQPPALFGAKHFAALRSLEGDRGAGALLHDAPTVALTASYALDIDIPEDLSRAEQLLRG